MKRTMSNPRIAACAIVTVMAIGCSFDFTANENANGNGNGGSGSDATRDFCVMPQDATETFDTAKIYIEHNATDEDTGVHGIIGVGGTNESCIFDPDGNLILAVRPQGNLASLGVADTFFESREPLNTEPGFSIDDILAMFPPGTYTITGTSAVDGTPFSSTALFTHTIPAEPVIIFPTEGAVVPTTDLVVTWEPVTGTIRGDSVDITGYEVIITKDVVDDPNSFARPVFDVHVPPTVTSLSISNEFMEPGTPYELEVLAIEFSGNQTIGIVFFETEPGAIPSTVPDVSAASFTDPTSVDNRFFPLTPGTVSTYEGETADGLERIVIEVLDETREVMGITCRVVRDRAFVDGVIVEDTFDWYAQDDDDNVWYMGEEVDEYNYDENGELIDITNSGVWEAGLDVDDLGTIALPGYIMLADPQPGDEYHQEYYRGSAEDMGEVEDVDVLVTLADGTSHFCVQIRDSNPLDPDAVDEFKYFAPGIGLVVEGPVDESERIELVSME